MKKILTLITLLVLSSAVLMAQTPVASPKPQVPDIGITATLALGDVTAMNAEQKTLTLKTKDGDITVTLSDATQYQKASPENPADLKLAIPAALTDIGVGDRLIASGRVSEDKKTLASRRVILMTKSDISKRQQAESEAWGKGINGKVAAVNPITKELTITVRGIMGERSIVISDTSNTKFRRYSPNSVKFSDAAAGRYEEVKTGDQLRARGVRSEDGTHFNAEEIISGSFRTAGGVITAIDTAKNEITINDVVTKKPVTITLSEATTLRKFPLEMAQRYVMMQAMAASGQMGQMSPGGQRPPGAQGAPGSGQTTGTPQTGQTPGGASGQPGQGGMVIKTGGGGRGDFDEMLERLPVIKLADLKVGEAIAVSSTPGQDPGRIAAIKLLAGVEPFLNAPAMQMPQNGARQSSPSINIPGLDGIGSP
jgi:ribosomal protein L24